MKRRKEEIENKFCHFFMTEDEKKRNKKYVKLEEKG